MYPPDDIAASDPNPGDPASTTTAAPGSKPTASGSDDPSPASQKEKDIDKLEPWARDEIKELRAEARDRRIKARDQELAAKAAADQALIDQKNWETLATNRANEIASLKPKADAFDELSTLFDRQVKDEIKDWPQDLLDMAPAEDAPITQRLAWLEKARPMAKKLMGGSSDANGAQKLPAAGNRRGPDPASNSLHQPAPMPKVDEGPLVSARRKF